jgi:hypothetical protein
MQAQMAEFERELGAAQNESRELSTQVRKTK